MATIQEILDAQMEQTGIKIKELMFARLRQQVPRIGNTPNNPFVTGKLARSLRPEIINFEKDDDGQWTLFIDLDALPAGVRWSARATNFGSKRHNEFDTIRRAGIFGLPFMGYSEGKMGIRAQNWTSMAGLEKGINKLVEDRLNVTFEQLMRETIKDYDRI